MAAENLIQVGAVVDIGAYRAGMAEAAAVTQQALAKMQASFAELEAKSSAAILALEERLAELEASMHTHARGGHEAMAGMAFGVEESGIKMSRHFRRLLAEIPLVNAAFTAMMPVLAMGIGVEILKHVAEKLGELIADTVIFTEEMKAEDKAQAALNKRWEESASRIKQIGREMQITAATSQAAKDALRLKFKLEDIGGTPAEIKAAIAKIQEEIKKATKEASATQDLSGEDGGVVTVMTDAAVEADVKVKELNLTLSDLQRQLREATAVSAQGAQGISNDLAAEQKALDAWAAHAAKTHGKLTDQVKKMAEEQAQAEIHANLTLTENEEKRVAKIIAAEQKLTQEKTRALEIGLDAARAHEAAIGQLATSRLAFELAIGKISEAEYEKRLAAELRETFKNEMAKLKLKRDAAEGNVVEQAKVDGEIKKLEDKLNADMEKSDENSYKRRTKNIDAFFSHMKIGMDSAISGMLKGTESFSKSMQQMWADMVITMAQKLAEMMLQWIAHHVEMLIVHVTEKQGEVAADGVAAGESKAISLADSIAKIHHSAAAAAARVYEAEAHLGPVIAGLLAAGTYTAVLGFKALASAEGGQYMVPGDQLTMLHSNEMVLPAGLAGRMRSVIDGGSSGGGDVHFHFAPTIQAMDSDGVDSVLTKHRQTFIAHVKKELKKRNMG